MLKLRDNNTWLAAPTRSFASLMELYENNYIYLRRLAPTLPGTVDRAVSRVSGAVDLHLAVIERCRYTTIVALTHHFDDPDGRQSLPGVTARVYHDARAAELDTRCALHRSFPNSRTNLGDRSAIARKWEANRFLNRWLRHCLKEGHRFSAEGADARPTVDGPSAALEPGAKPSAHRPFP